MLDLHAIADTTGYVALTNISLAANIPANDGQSSAGVPIAPGAVLKGWGAMTTIADTLMELQLISQDQIDSINGEHWLGAAASVLGIMHFDSFLPFQRGLRALYVRQNTGAADIVGYTLDQYPSPASAQVKNFGRRIILTQVFGGALTAITWGSQVLAPASMIPAGKYALLGVYVHTLTNHALIRFSHADFGGKKPGFPVVDESKAAARATVPINVPLFNANGSQFWALGDIPIFNVTVQGTGLTIEMMSITADTPTVNLVLVQIA